MNFTKFMLLITVVLFADCASPRMFIHKNYQDTSFSFGKIKKDTRIKVCVSDNITKEAFQNAFIDEYLSNRQFSNIVYQQVVDNLGTVLENSASVNNFINDDTLANRNDSERTIAELGSTDAEYLLIVRGIEITRTATHGTTPLTCSPSTPGYPMNSIPEHSMSATSVNCFVTMHAELWSIKDKKKIVSYSATGESDVNFGFAKTALRQAATASINSLSKYLLTGMSY